MNNKKPALYIMASKINGTLYTGVTSDLLRRVYEHREGRGEGFSKQYGCKVLVWYSFFETMTDVIRAEKLLKMKSRFYKIKLIESFNLSWSDLYEHVYHQ